MKFRKANRIHAITRLEVCVLIAIVGIAGFLVYRGLVTSWRRMVQMDCVSNLKYIGLAYREWADDHGGQYPMSVLATNETGLFDRGEIWRTYLMMSNELGTPKILHCPEDNPATVASDFSGTFRNSNISYFTGLDAGTNSPKSLLSGDDNLQLDGTPLHGLVQLTSDSPAEWTASRHRHSGNIGLADGSVQQVTIPGLQEALRQTGLATNRLVLR